MKSQAISLYWLVATTVAVADPQAGLIEITPEYPKPMYIGPSVLVLLPNLENPETTISRKKSFLAPAGTRLLSAGKSVTSSNPVPVEGELRLITDGDASHDSDTVVELAEGPQWVCIDLEQTAAISHVLVWHYHRSVRAYIDVVIQVSNDPAFIKGVTTVFNADHENSISLGEGKDLAYIETNHGRLVETGIVRGRYVRLWSNGNTENDRNHYCEVLVYGVTEEGNSNDPD